MRKFEARCLRKVSRALTLTRRDQERLSRVSGLPIHRLPVVPAPFVSPLESNPEHFPGSPAVLLSDSSWLPNRDGADWFLSHVWPTVRRELPSAVLHVFGDRADDGRNGVVYHTGPLDSRTMFPANGISVVPLRVASGVRMKILEAWARGVPVVATPVACQGLEVPSGEGVLTATSAREFADAIGRLHSDAELKRQLLSTGREVMARHYQPAVIAHRLEEHYRSTIVDHRLATTGLEAAPSSVVVQFHPGGVEPAAQLSQLVEMETSEGDQKASLRTP
jgi:hypothetical protein